VARCALLAASLVLAFMPPVAGIPLAAYMAVGLLLLGGMAALPWLLGSVLDWYPRPSRASRWPCWRWSARGACATPPPWPWAAWWPA
jgi:hypothetical protein